MSDPIYYGYWAVEPVLERFNRGADSCSNPQKERGYFIPRWLSVLSLTCTQKLEERVAKLIAMVI